MINVNKIQEVLYAEYLYLISTLKTSLQFYDYFVLNYKTYQLTYFDGFLFKYNPQKQEVHVFRNPSYRNKWFSLKTLQDYEKSLPKPLTLQIIKTQPVLKRLAEKVGFWCKDATDTHFIMYKGI